MIYTRPKGVVTTMNLMKNGQRGITINNYGYSQYDDVLVEKFENEIRGRLNENEADIYTWNNYSQLKVELL